MLEFIRAENKFSFPPFLLYSFPELVCCLCYTILRVDGSVSCCTMPLVCFFIIFFSTTTSSSFNNLFLNNFIWQLLFTLIVRVVDFLMSFIIFSLLCVLNNHSFREQQSLLSCCLFLFTASVAFLSSAVLCSVHCNWNEKNMGQKCFFLWCFGWLLGGNNVLLLFFLLVVKRCIYAVDT